MRAQEVADELGVSVAYAYKVIRTLNKELASKGYIILQGRIDRRFFHEKMYASGVFWLLSECPLLYSTCEPGCEKTSIPFLKTRPAPGDGTHARDISRERFVTVLPV